MDAELTGWKVKLYDIINKMDQLSPEDRGNINEKVNNVLSLMIDLNGILDTLQSQPHVDWQGKNQAIQEKMAELREKYTSTEEALNDCVQ